MRERATLHYFYNEFFEFEKIIKTDVTIQEASLLIIKQQT